VFGYRVVAGVRTSNRGRGDDEIVSSSWTGSYVLAMQKVVSSSLIIRLQNPRKTGVFGFSFSPRQHESPMHPRMNQEGVTIDDRLVAEIFHVP
jgi:hypothetical protein